MKAEFLEPKFEGARFQEHTLPLEVARDLAAYETLIIELGKHLYLREHPERQRVPKGFGAEFHLHLERIDSGSAVPVLAVVTLAALPLGEPVGQGVNPYFEQARDVVANCVAAPSGQLPDEFPRELLGYFNQLGRSLREDESLRLSSNAVLTPQRRKELVLAAARFYEREIELNGTIGEADWEKSTFRLRLPDASQVIVPMTENFQSVAREYGGRNRFGITIKGVGNYDSWDKLQKVVTVESLDIQPNYQLTTKFEGLAVIENGWYEGQGLAPNQEQLAIIAEKFVENYPEILPLPFIVPTPEGNLLFEWNVLGEPSVDLKISSLFAEFHAFAPDGSDIERDFSLNNSEDWHEFFLFLENHVEVAVQ